MFVQMFLNDHAPKKHGKVKSEEPPNMFWTIAPWAEPIAIFRTRVCSIKRNDRRRPSPKSSTRVPHFIGLGRPTPRDPWWPLVQLIRSFEVSRTPLNAHWSAKACSGDRIALLLSLFWGPLWPLWSTLGSLGAHFGTPGSPLRRLRGVSRQHWRFCVLRRPLRKPRALKYRACAQK